MERGLHRRITGYFYLARSYTRFMLTGNALSFPLTVQIQTKSLCNGRCLFCPYPEVSKSLEQGTMELGLYKKVVDELSLAKYPRNIIFDLQNEPLLDNRVFELIKYLKTRNPGKECYIVTNGQLIDKFDIQEIEQSGLDKLTISLNAYSPEKYEITNRGLDYERVLRNISLVLSKDELKSKLILSFVLAKETADEVQPALRFWREKGVRTRTIDMVNRAGTLSHFDSLRLKRDPVKRPFVEKITKFAISCILNIIGCHEPFYHMNILFNGDVILCCHDWKRTVVIGNVKEFSLKEIWNSPQINAVRKSIMRKKYSHIKSCENCSMAR